MKLIRKLNISEIDKQHENFLYILNELYGALYSSRPHNELEIIFNELFVYLKYHFNTEEKYFESFNYKNAHHHKLQHQALLN